MYMYNLNVLTVRPKHRLHTQISRETCLGNNDYFTDNCINFFFVYSVGAGIFRDASWHQREGQIETGTHTHTHT